MAIRHALREIERKFAFNVRLLPVVLCNGGTPPFRELTPPKFTSIHDMYFDNTSRVLSKNPAGAIWLRKRQSQWQAKVTQSGDKDFKRVTYTEIRDLDQIKSLVAKFVPGCPGPEEDFGLHTYCDYVTYRTEFGADGRFTVALDVTDFGHDVGEVEVLAAPEEQSDKVLQEIEGFMDKYQWLFKSGQGEPKGKMSAYFEKFGGW